MIQLAHVATGALAGRRANGHADAFVAGVLLHAVMDVIPHGEIDDGDFEIITGALGVLALAARFGWRSPITVAAIGSIVPDMEHLPQRFGIHQPTLFPTHRAAWSHGWEHKPLAIPAWAQAIIGGAIIGGIALAGRRR